MTNRVYVSSRNKRRNYSFETSIQQRSTFRCFWSLLSVSPLQKRTNPLPKTTMQLLKTAVFKSWRNDISLIASDLLTENLFLVILQRVSFSGNFGVLLKLSSHVPWQIRDQNIGEKYIVCNIYFHAKFAWISLLFYFWRNETISFLSFPFSLQSCKLDGLRVNLCKSRDAYCLISSLERSMFRVLKPWQGLITVITISLKHLVVFKTSKAIPSTQKSIVL